MQRIVNKYQSHLETPFSEEIVCELHNHESLWEDAVFCQLNNNTYLADKEAFSGDASDTLNGYIFRRLGHLVVNPNNKDRTRAITNSYVFAEKSDIDKGVCNNNPEDAGELIDFLITESHIQRNATTQEKQLQKSSHMILYGERGSGKTCFLNYLLSKYSDRLDDKKTIWVRLNLVETFGVDIDLLQWIQAQEMKIICRYYDPTSKNYSKNKHNIKLNAGNHLFQFINNRWGNDPERLNLMRDKADAVLDCLYDKEKDRPLTPDFLPTSFSMEIKKIALDQGFSFIVVLDGLDQLELTYNSELKHRKLVESAGNLVTSLTGTREFYVLVSRTSSVQERGVPYVTGQERHEEIITVPISSIFSKRIDFLKRECCEQKNIRDWSEGDCKERLINFYNHIVDHETIYRESGNVNSSIIDFLEVFFNSNKRAAIQLIQVYYHNFLKFEGEKTYALTENITRNGKAFPIRIYNYIIDNEGFVRSEKKQGRTFDNIFLNSIFMFPIITIGQNNKQYPIKPDLILLGIRVLQLIVAHDKFCEDRKRQKQNVEKLMVFELIEICSQLFRYDEKYIDIILKEFSELQLITIVDRDFNFPNDIMLCGVTSLPKAIHLLNYFIYDIAYLNLASMRVPLPAKLLTSEYPLITACFLEKNISSFEQWIFRKLANSSSICRLVQHINCKQKDYYTKININKVLDKRLTDTVLKAFYSVTSIHGGMFDFADKMVEAIKRQSNYIISSINATGKFQENVANKLSKFMDSNH